MHPIVDLLRYGSTMEPDAYRENAGFVEAVWDKAGDDGEDVNDAESLSGAALGKAKSDQKPTLCVQAFRYQG